MLPSYGPNNVYARWTVPRIFFAGKLYPPHGWDPTFLTTKNGHRERRTVLNGEMESEKFQGGGGYGGRRIGGRSRE